MSEPRGAPLEELDARSFHEGQANAFLDAYLRIAQALRGDDAGLRTRVDGVARGLLEAQRAADELAGDARRMPHDE